MKDEQALLDEIKTILDKQQHVKLIYEKVIDNIKVMCKLEKKPEESMNQSYVTANNTSLINVNESRTYEPSGLNEEEIFKSYLEFLETSKKSMDSLFLSQSREDFLNMMKEKGVDTNNTSGNNPTSSSIRNKTKKLSKRSTVISMNMDKSLEKNLMTNANNEYDYSDSELKKEDKNIKDDNDDLIREYKAIVILS